MSELSHVNRIATAGQLSASIAHEVDQPLAGIVANAQAALRWLEKANVGGTRRLKRIVSEGHRQATLSRPSCDVQKRCAGEALVDINELVLSVPALVRIDPQSMR